MQSLKSLLLEVGATPKVDKSIEIYASRGLIFIKLRVDSEVRTVTGLRLKEAVDLAREAIADHRSALQDADDNVISLTGRRRCTTSPFEGGAA